MPGSDTPSARRVSIWLLALAALVASLVLAYGAYALAGYSWDQVVSYRSPYTGLTGAGFSGVRPRLDQPIPGAVSRRVVVVLIDGLREDVSRTMPSIERIRAEGADVSLITPQPSLSYPMWTTIMTGAPPQISGVTTNWFEGPVHVETLLDVMAGSGRSVVVAGTDDLDTMFRAAEVADAASLVPWSTGEYMTAGIVDGALAADRAVGGADFVFVLIPDIDDAGHAYGGASAEYANVAARVDSDLARLFDGLDDGATTFFVLPDHGHIDTGGHGGWEKDVIGTWAAIAGPGVRHTDASAGLADIAPTVAVVAGVQAPLQAMGTAIDAVLDDPNGASRDAEFIRGAGVTLAYIDRVSGERPAGGMKAVESPASLADMRTRADDARLARERGDRALALAGVALALVVLAAAIGVVSSRALVSALAGAAAYSLVYNALFFLVHHLDWSLSAFNDESMIEAFFMHRMAEAALSGIVACIVAALVYAATRARSTAGRSTRGIEWVALGSATVLLAQALLAVQVALFVWRWGVRIEWLLPDFREAFKYDLDLMQVTGLGVSALLGPLFAWAVGRIADARRARAA